MLYTAILISMCFALILTVFYGIYILIKCKSSKRLYLLLLVASVVIIVLAYILELLSTNASGALNSSRVDYLGTAYLGILFLLFVLDLANIKIKGWCIALLMVIPTIAVILVWTTPLHRYYYESYLLKMINGIPCFKFEPAPFLYIYHIYTFVLMCTTTFVILYQFFETRLFSLSQTIILLIGSIVPSAVNVIYIFEFSIDYIKYTPIALVLSVTLFFISLVNYDIFNIVSRASEMAIDYMKEAFILIDSRGYFLDANAATFAIFPELKNLSRKLSVNDVELWPKQLENFHTKAESDDRIEFSIERGGDIYYYSATVSEIKDTNRKALGFIILIQDISSIASLLGRLENMAFIDYLTGIFNRRYFMETAQQMVVKFDITGQKSAIIIFDLDNFKQVNDTYGHVAGDAVLKTITGSVQGLFRTCDLFARYGGEEFVVLAFSVKKEVAMKIAERIRKKVQETETRYGENIIKVTVSVGVSIQSVKIHSLDDLIEKADQALYMAKNNGRNRVELLE